jgi:uncharacterized membrane protein
VIVALGTIFVMPWMQAAAERHGVAATRFYLDFVWRVLRMLVLPGAVVVLVLGGIVMSNDHFYGHDDMPVWLAISIIWFIVAAVAGFFALRKTLREAAATLATVPDGAPMPEAYRPLSQRLQMIFGLLALSIIVIAFLMVQQPGR